MATLKTIQAGAVQTPMQGARIDASVFGDSSGANAVAQGLNNLSQGLQSVSRDNQAISMHLKQLGDTQYLSKLSAEATKYSGEFLDDPNNAANPDFHTAYEKHMQKFAAVWTSAAPSKEAKIHAQAHVDQIAAGGYNVALKTVVQKKVQDTALALEDGINGQGNMISQMFATDPVAAEGMARGALSKYQEDVTKNFGKTNPVLANKLLEQGTVGMIDRVLHQSPTLARQLLSEANLDGQKYSALETKIQHVEDANNFGARKSLLDSANRIERSAMNGVGTATMIPRAAFDVFGPHAQAYFDDHQRTMQNIEKANGAYESVMGRPPTEQAYALKSFMEAHPDNVEAQHILQKKLHESATLYQHDPVEWMKKEIPSISYRASLVQELIDTKAPKEQILEARQQLNDDILNYQGRAPEGARDPRTAYFQNLPNPHLLSKTSAKSIAETLNNAKGSDAVQQVIGDLMNMYPTPEQFAIISSDMKALLPEHEQPKVAIQAAFANMGQPWLPGFLTSQFNREANKKIIGEKVHTDLENQIRTSPEVLKWANAFGDSEGRNFAEAQAAIQDYAAELTARPPNLKPKDAVVTATQRIFGSTRHLVSVGSNDTVIPKTGKINDDTVKRVPAILGRMVEGLDISQINVTAHFPTYALFQEPAQEEAAIRSSMQLVGHWAVSPDERSLQFRMLGDDGKPYVLTDLKGDPIQVDIEDVGDIVTSGRDWIPYDVGAIDFGDVAGGSGVSPASEIYQIGLPSSRTGIKNKSNLPFRK